MGEFSTGSLALATIGTGGILGLSGTLSAFIIFMMAGLKLFGSERRRHET